MGLYGRPPLALAGFLVDSSHPGHRMTVVEGLEAKRSRTCHWQTQTATQYHRQREAVQL